MELSILDSVLEFAEREGKKGQEIKSNQRSITSDFAQQLRFLCDLATSRNKTLSAFPFDNIYCKSFTCSILCHSLVNYLETL